MASCPHEWWQCDFSMNLYSFNLYCKLYTEIFALHEPLQHGLLIWMNREIDGCKLSTGRACFSHEFLGEEMIFHIYYTGMT